MLKLIMSLLKLEGQWSVENPINLYSSKINALYFKKKLKKKKIEEETKSKWRIALVYNVKLI